MTSDQVMATAIFLLSLAFVWHELQHLGILP